MKEVTQTQKRETLEALHTHTHTHTHRAFYQCGFCPLKYRYNLNIRKIYLRNKRIFSKK